MGWGILNLFYWPNPHPRFCCCLNKKLFSLHGGFLTYEMYHHRGTIILNGTYNTNCRLYMKDEKHTEVLGKTHANRANRLEDMAVERLTIATLVQVT